MPIKLLIGLRNPGAEYQQTRHNAGAWLVCAWAKRQGVSFRVEKKFQAELASLSKDACYALLPLVFMNHNGTSVRAVSQFYRIEPHEMLVVHDDLDLPCGRVKLKTGGGHGGHNGLRDLITQLHSADFHRLRIGIGHPGDKTQVHNYVLGAPSMADKQTIMQGIDQALDSFQLILDGHLERAMNQLHR